MFRYCAKSSVDLEERLDEICGAAPPTEPARSAFKLTLSRLCYHRTGNGDSRWRKMAGIPGQNHRGITTTSAVVRFRIMSKKSPTTIVRHDVRLTYKSICGHTVEEKLFIRSVFQATNLLISTLTSRHALILRKSSHWHAYEPVCVHIYWQAWVLLFLLHKWLYLPRDGTRLCVV